MDKELQISSVVDADHEMVSQQHISQQPQKRKGGLITIPFIIGQLSYLSILNVSCYLQLSHPPVYQRRMTQVLLFFLFVRAILHEILTSYTWSFTLKRTLGFLFSLNEIEFCCIIWFCFVVTANEALARMASLGLLPNMILYFMGSYRLHLGKATQILLLSSAASNFTPVVGAFIADSYLGRFLGVGLGSAVSFLVICSILFFLSHFTVFFLSFDLHMHMIQFNFGSL
jgi:uncharacterized membrane protein required for colicin V production